MLPPELVPKKGPTFHDFPYAAPERKCLHCWIINVTPPGKYQCLHQCRYCYARDAVYATDAKVMRIYNNLPELVERELHKISLCPPISLSNASDPCQDIAPLKREVKRLVKLLMEYGVSFLITTKGNPSFLLDLPGFVSYQNMAVAITIEGTSDLLPLLSPGAPAFRQRLDALQTLSGYGIRTIVRFDPLFMHLFEAFYGDRWFDQIISLLRMFAGAGARHVISSTGRLSGRKGKTASEFHDSTRDRIAGIIRKYSAVSAEGFARDYIFESG